MLTYSSDIDAARLADCPESLAVPDGRYREESGPLRLDDLQFESSRAAGDEQLDGGKSGRYALEIRPAHAANRRTIAMDGITFETVQCLAHDRVEFEFGAPRHLLLVHQDGVREHGETTVRNFRSSKLRVLKRKLTFVPAGYRYQDWQQPRVPSRMTCLYFDPAKMPVDTRDMDSPALQLAPRLFFEHRGLWEATAKLTAAMDLGRGNKRYCEALAVIVAHELMQSCRHSSRAEPSVSGGLAVWQRHAVAGHIEQHLAEPIPLATLAARARLSSCYFCRAFKQSFGTPPHRYHINRRIERAKALLDDPGQSVTDIALALGFSDTSSFSAAFRHVTGIPPTLYRRSRAPCRGANDAGAHPAAAMPQASSMWNLP